MAFVFSAVTLDGELSASRKVHECRQRDVTQMVRPCGSDLMLAASKKALEAKEAEMRAIQLNRSVIL